MKTSVYVETSVISYAAARQSRDLIVAAHQQITQEWWPFAMKRYRCYVSAVVLDEAMRGDREMVVARKALLRGMPALEVTDGVRELAEYYMKKLSIPDKAQADAYHLALAVEHGMEFLVSWNMAHIVNGAVIRQLSILNEQRGVGTPVICTPEELMEA